MKTKTSKISHAQNVTTTITTLRQTASEMLNVANHLEATQRFAGNGVTPMVHARSPGKRRLSIVGKRKIAKANTVRTTRRKELPVVGKAAAA